MQADSATNEPKDDEFTREMIELIEKRTGTKVSDEFALEIYGQINKIVDWYY